MFWMSLIGLAAAVPPDDLAVRISVYADEATAPTTGTTGTATGGTSGGSMGRMSMSQDGALFAGRDLDEGALWLLYLEDFSTPSWTGAECTVNGAAVRDLSDGTYEIWASCKEGFAKAFLYDGFDLTEQTWEQDGEPVELAIDDELLNGVWYAPNTDELYFVSAPGDGVVSRAHVMDASTLAVNDQWIYGWNALGMDLYDDGLNAAIATDTYFMVSHGQEYVSSIPLGSASFTTSTGVSSVGVDDLADNGLGGFWATDSNGIVTQFSPGSNTFQTVITDLVDPRVLCVSLDEYDQWLMVLSETMEIWDIENGAIVGGFDGPVATHTPTEEQIGEPNDCLATDSYAFAAGEDGNVQVYTSRPWLYRTKISASPTSGTSGETVTVSFVPAEDVDYDVYRGGTRFGDGAWVTSGFAEGGRDNDFITTVDLTIDDSWDEGDNRIYVIGTSVDNGLSGHAATSVNVDNPPQPPDLSQANITFGDASLNLRFTGIDDADLDYYEVYVTQTSFEAGDWTTGGPEYDGSTSLSTPIRIDASGGEDIDYRIEPLENHVTYYVAVRATDTGAKEGPMSNVIHGTPRPTFTAAELAGEAGGAPSCSTTGSAAGWLAGLGALVALGRRRRSAALGATVLAGSLVSATAHAGRGDTCPLGGKPKQDMTCSTANFELRYGVVNLHEAQGQNEGASNPIDDVYNDNPHNVTYIEMGPQALRMFELDFGFGFFQELDETVSSTGVESGDKTMLTWFPLLVDGTFRLQVFDEQLLVPFVRYGYDYVLWSEKSDDGLGGKNVIRGAKQGNHHAFGANLLLDPISPGRASLLEAQTGINDTFLTFEWRRQRIDHRSAPWAEPNKQGLDFSADSFTVGLKLDF